MDPLGPQRAHIEAEAAKLAYDARNRFIADPDHTARLDHMLAPGTAARLAALIDPTNAMPAAAPLTEAVHRDTVYITVVDRDRMAVSLIYSLFRGFGSGIASERFGLLLQNRGSGFCLTPGHPNEMAGGKRPMHTIIPGMLAEGGRVTMPFGVMGGAYQPAGHARLVSNLVDFGMDPQTAIDAPRCFADGGTLRVERGYPEATRRALTEMGHDVTVPRPPSAARRRCTSATTACWRAAAIRARTGSRWDTDGRGAPVARAARAPSVQLEMQRVVPVLERPEEIGNVGMLDRFAGIVRHQVLFADIGDVVALIVLGQQVVERLLLRRAAVLGNGVVPFLGIGEFRIDIEHNPAERVLLVADDLTQVIFCTCLQHHD